jgi:hypothetical protein
MRDLAKYQSGTLHALHNLRMKDDDDDDNNNNNNNNNRAEGLQNHLRWKVKSQERGSWAPGEPSFTKPYCGRQGVRYNGPCSP